TDKDNAYTLGIHALTPHPRPLSRKGRGEKVPPKQKPTSGEFLLFAPRRFVAQYTIAESYRRPQASRGPHRPTPRRPSCDGPPPLSSPGQHSRPVGTCNCYLCATVRRRCAPRRDAPRQPEWGIAVMALDTSKPVLQTIGR